MPTVNITIYFNENDYFSIDVFGRDQIILNKLHDK